MTEFNVLFWDINHKELVPYDVLPYFRAEYKKLKKKDRPITRDQWAEFVRRNGMYRYWGQCQYEMLVSEWPCSKDLNKDKHIKIDVWNQIQMNLELVIDILMSEV